MALRNLGRHDAAAECFRRALGRDPANGAALVALAVAERQICDWRTPRDAEIRARVANGDAAIEPFDFLSFAESGPEQLRCARNYWSGFAMPAPLVGTAAQAPRDRIRIAYLSFDYSVQRLVRTGIRGGAWNRMGTVLARKARKKRAIRTHEHALMHRKSLLDRGFRHC